MTNIRQILKKLRKYEVRIRKAVNSRNMGSFTSIFKGQGLEFEDVREYQYGDDVRAINWSVSAKGHGVFVKKFREEKEQTVFFIMDVSASQYIGQKKHRKLDVAREICGVLILSAIRELSKVGLVLFSDQREYYLKPSKGNLKAYEAIKHLFATEPASTKTSLKKALQFTQNVNPRKSMVIVVSDFVDRNIDKHLINMSKKHDLVCIHVKDQMETRMPSLGIVPVMDLESGKKAWVNTSLGGFTKKLAAELDENAAHLTQLAKRYRFEFLTIDTRDDFVPQLIRLFRMRNLNGK